MWGTIFVVSHIYLFSMVSHILAILMTLSIEEVNTLIIIWHLLSNESFTFLVQIANIVCSSIQPLQGYAVIVGITSTQLQLMRFCTCTRSIYLTTLQGLHEGRMSPDEGLHIVQTYIDKGFRGVISCNLMFAK